MGPAGFGWQGPSFASDAARVWGACRTLWTDGSSAEWLCPARGWCVWPPEFLLTALDSSTAAILIRSRHLIGLCCGTHCFFSSEFPSSSSANLLLFLSNLPLLQSPPPTSLRQISHVHPCPKAVMVLALTLCMALDSQIASVSNIRIISLFLTLYYFVCLADSKYLINVS